MKQVVWLFVFLGYLALFSCLAALADEKVRTWTDIQGRPMQAQFVRELDGDVTFLKDGKLIVIPLDQLSEADRRYIRNLEANKALPTDARPGSTAAASGEAVPPATSGGHSPSLTKKVIVPSNRVWTDTSGNKMTATFVRLQDKNVVVVRTGRTVSIPFDSLIAEDQAYVREVLTARGEGGLLPPLEATGTPRSDAPEAASSPKASATGAEPINSDPGPSVPRGNSAIFDAMREREAKRRQEQSEFAAAPPAKQQEAQDPKQEPKEPIAASPSVPSEPQSTKTEVVRHVDETDLTHGGPPSEQATVSPAVTSVRSLVMVVVAIVGVIGTIAIVVSVAIALASPNSSRQGRRYS